MGKDLLGEISVLAFDVPADAEYGTIRAKLETAGTQIGSNDLLIAAHALATGAIMVTANAMSSSVYAAWMSRIGSLDVSDQVRFASVPGAAWSAKRGMVRRRTGTVTNSELGTIPGKAQHFRAAPGKRRAVSGAVP
jgi:hypothetical protein